MSVLFAAPRPSRATRSLRSKSLRFSRAGASSGRLWQTALLGSWREEFFGVPVENIVWAHQQEYYAAIRAASAQGDSGPFIDFMLDKILRALKAKGRALGSGVTLITRITPQVVREVV